MKGLLKNNCLAASASGKTFSVFLAVFGLFCVLVTSQSLQIAFPLIAMVGFSLCAVSAAKNEFASKWWKYKLTLPVKRGDIIVSQFVNLLLWLLVGAAFAAIELGLSWALHGCQFDLKRDIFTLFGVGVSASLFLSAAFFPLFYLGGPEKSEVFLVISALFAFAMVFGVTTAVNEYLGPNVSLPAFLAGLTILILSSLVVFALSCPLTVLIFRGKEY